MNKKIIIPLLVLTIIFSFGVGYYQDSNVSILNINELQELIKLDSEPTHEKLAKNLVKSVENLCYGIAPVEEISVCNTMDVIFTGFVSSFPPLDSKNRFDAQYCENVDNILYSLDKLMYRDNYQEKGFFDLSDEELRKKVTISFLEKDRMDMSYYDVAYDFIEAVDEFLLFWNDSYNASCNTT